MFCRTWRILAIIGFILLIIALLLMATEFKYVVGINNGSALVASDVLSDLNANVDEIVMVHAPLRYLPFYKDKDACHMGIVCVTSIGDIVVSIGSFGGVRVNKCNKRNGSETEWESADMYYSSFSTVASYLPIKPITVNDAIRETISLMAAKPYSLFDYNCHLTSMEVVKKLCKYEPNDPNLQRLTGWKLVKTVASRMVGNKHSLK